MHAVARPFREFGGIDILVANAGVLWLGPIESTPLKRWQLCLNVNLTGVFLVTKAVIPHVQGARRRVVDRRSQRPESTMIDRVERLLGVQGRRRAAVPAAWPQI